MVAWPSLLSQATAEPPAVPYAMLWQLGLGAALVGLLVIGLLVVGTAPNRDPKYGIAGEPSGSAGARAVVDGNEDEKEDEGEGEGRAGIMFARGPVFLPTSARDASTQTKSNEDSWRDAEPTFQVTMDSSANAHATVAVRQVPPAGDLHQPTPHHPHTCLD